jgi:1,4-dihydroxy-6-naphthoate synthase
MNTTQKLTLGFSSCPNDTFIFDAMIHGKIDTEGLEFELFIGDVEELNRKAFNRELDITKISFNAYTRLADNYILLDSGAALGKLRSLDYRERCFPAQYASGEKDCHSRN